MNTSKRLLEMMKRESEEEDRPSIEELVEQMDYKLNKQLALMENTLHLQMIDLLVNNNLIPVYKRIAFCFAFRNLMNEKRSIMAMPASPIFKSGGDAPNHHKFTLDEQSGEIVVKHPKTNPILYPKPAIYVFR